MWVVTYIGETFSAAKIRTFMWLVTSVSAAMDGQSTSLDESLFAGLVVTRIWSLVCVDAVVSLEI